MNKKLKMAIISAVAAFGIMSQVFLVRASEIGAEALLQTALSQNTFYSFNMAYASILKMEDGNAKNAMLSKLDTLTAIIWNEDIKKFNLALDKLVQTASGKLYDQIVTEVSNSKLNEMDKGLPIRRIDRVGQKISIYL